MDTNKPTLSVNLIAIVDGYLSGKRREKFRDSISILNRSLAQGAWTPRGSVKASAGFYQGLAKKIGNLQPYELDACVRYGQPMRSVTLTDEMCMQLSSSRVLRAWVTLCSEVAAARAFLDAARPTPVVTAIGLSPKVTKTLKDCNLDIDLATIKPAKISFYEVQARDKAGELRVDRDGKPVMERVYFVDWSAGCLFNRSRFAMGDGCHACGKTIPSGRFVPIEASCKKLGQKVALWLGCDCARNIFGVKDIGIDKNAKAPTAGE